MTFGHIEVQIYTCAIVVANICIWRVSKAIFLSQLASVSTKPISDMVLNQICV